MNLRSAARGFLAFLLSIPELLGDNDWTATYKSSNVCALRGSTLHFSCTYEYPYHVQHCYATVLETLWFTKEGRNQPVDIKSDTDYEGRVTYSCQDERHFMSKCFGTCSLSIKDVRQSDSAEYQFRTKITEQSEWGYTINHGVNLTVTDLQVKLAFLHSDKPTKLDLECHSICGLGNSTYKWLRNGENAGPGSHYKGLVNSEDSYACAAEGFERFSSPSVYAPRTPSVTVSHSGEIEEGSSVTLSCSSDANPAATYTWFKEQDDSVEESGQNYTLSNMTSEHGGHYYCQACNAIGRHNSTWSFVNVTARSSSSSLSSSSSSSSSSGITAAAVGSVAVFLATILFLILLWLGRRRASRKACDQGGRLDITEESLPVAVHANVSSQTNHSTPVAQGEPMKQQDEVHYSVIHISHSEKQKVPHRLAGSHVQSDQQEQVLYSAINFQGPNAAIE